MEQAVAQLSGDALTVYEVANKYATHPNTVHLAIGTGRLPSFKVGRQTFIWADEAAAWIKTVQVRGRRASQ